MSTNPASADLLDAIPDILRLLRNRTGVDFSAYRAATVHRRVANHMLATGASGVREYLDMLAQQPMCAHALLERITIKVSSFYRNAATFDLLRHTILPELAAAANGAPLRIWSAGCARGEEAYTYAMMLEALGVEGSVLGSDIDGAAIEAARLARYDDRSVATLPEDFGERFLLATSDARAPWEVAPDVRRRVRFIRHDITSASAPDEHRFDIVSCRNVLIYLQRELHDRSLRALCERIQPSGYLCLGEAEWPSPAVMRHLQPLPRKTRLFRVARADAGGHT